MNNRFVKNNIGLLVVTGLCALVALVVLVFVIIYTIEMYDNIRKLGDLRGKISEINTKRPVPVEENKQPISDDIAVYKTAAAKLHKLFGRPLAPAVDRFFEVLTLKKSMWIPEGIDENDEVIKRLYVLAGEGQSELTGKPQFPSLNNEAFDKCLDRIAAEALARKIKELAGDEDKAKISAIIPDVDALNEEALAKKILDSADLDKKLRAVVTDSDPETLKKLRGIEAKFTAEKFIEIFKSRVLNNNENDKNFADRRTRFDDFRRDQFENWSAARDAFIAAAENRQTGDGAEKIGPCIVEKLDAENADDVLLAALGIPRRLNGDSAYLKRMLDNVVGQLVKTYQVQIVGSAQGLGIVTISDTAQESMGQGGGDLKSINPDDYPAVATHLDIISYMLYRIGASGVVVWDVQIRQGSGGSSGGDEFSAAKSFSNSTESRDGFEIYHYTLEISGTMAEIRDAVKRLDDCYAVRRVYLIKNIALYAENNIVDSIFTGVRAADRRQQETRQEIGAAMGGRRRRPRSGVANSEELGGGDDSAAKLEEQKRLEEEYRQRQLKLDPDKRDGYGEPITAGGAKETFRAVVDVEYVVKAEK